MAIGAALDYLGPKTEPCGLTSGVDKATEKQTGVNPSNVDPLQIMDNRARAVQQRNQADADAGKLLDPIYLSVPQTEDTSANAGAGIVSGILS